MAETLADTNISCEWYDIPCNVDAGLDWLFDFLLWLPRKIFEQLIDGLAAAVNAIPVPGFFGSAGNFFAQIPPGVVFFVDFAELPTGISIILSAYIARFVLRRIPLIG